MYDLVILNACYYKDKTFLAGNIYVENGKIVKITETSEVLEAKETIDAKGMKVLPGLMDSHVHLREPGKNEREDFFTGTCAAAAGGFTTVCEMPNVIPPVYNVDILKDRVKLAEEKAIIDIGFYGAAGYSNRENYKDMIDFGACSMKTFLNPAPKGREGEFLGLTVDNDGQLYQVLQKAGEIGKGRFIFHCENCELISEMEKHLHEIGAEDYSFHYMSRPNVAEAESIGTIVAFAKATGAKVGVAHISTPEGCEVVKRAKAAGVDVIAETCFQYLTYTWDDILKFGPYAKCNPPLRSKESVAKMWDYVNDGTIDYIGSDHAPLLKSEKEVGMEQIWKAFSGMPGIEAFIPVMLNHVHAGRLSLERMTEMMSEKTASLMHFENKGKIEIGKDADFTIIDLNQKSKIDITKMYTKNAEINTMFDGLEVNGKVIYTISRGEIVAKEGVVDLSKKGRGRMVKSNWNC